MERETYRNLEELDLFQYIMAIRRGDKAVLFHLLRKAGYGFSSGIITAGVGLQKKVAESVRP
jgi:hypothetical protein